MGGSDQPTQSMSQLTLMAVFAHPDDESFGVGGTLAKYAAEGHDVHLVTATRGEAGRIAEPDLATPANLPAVRERELRRACETYGINPPHLLDYVDGQLPIVHQGQAVGKLVQLIRQIMPDVLLTFGPDGAYGHYDHIAVHRWATIAFDLSNDPDCFPGQALGECRPHQVSKLYYLALAEERLADMTSDGRPNAGPPAVMMDGVPFAFVGRPSEEITTVIDVSDFAATKVSGIQCHVTQVGRQSIWSALSDEDMRDPWLQQETFVRARSVVDIPPGVEVDLLAGLRQS